MGYIQRWKWSWKVIWPVTTKEPSALALCRLRHFQLLGGIMRQLRWRSEWASKSRKHAHASFLIFPSIDALFDWKELFLTWTLKGQVFCDTLYTFQGGLYGLKGFVKPSNHQQKMQMVVSSSYNLANLSIITKPSCELTSYLILHHRNEFNSQIFHWPLGRLTKS